MGLSEYRRKRRFTVTSEPRGEDRGGPPRWAYVVQKHAATRLHYDFRLELDGVLKSWAVPKGPSLDPTDKRLAMATEDHPLEYAAFEGVIPERQYGAGKVLLWDRGTWRPLGDAREGLRRGKLDFELAGEKLRGRWHLVRIGGVRATEAKEWLLIKGRDAAANAEIDVVAELPLSVASGVPIERIGEDGTARVWNSDRPAAPRRARASARRATARVARVEPIDPATVAGAKKGALVVPRAPQLATLVSAAPAGEPWIHEIKFDGYRLFCVVQGGKLQWRSRNGVDWSKRLPVLSRSVLRLPVRSALLDGELVKLTSTGAASFQELQNALDAAAQGELDYYAFDLLHLDGYRLDGVRLDERKRVLASLFGTQSAGEHGVHYCAHVEGDGRLVFAEACRLALEGIVSKRRDRPYRPGRSPEWQKTKCMERQEFVIGGWTDPQGGRAGLGALLLGVYEDGGLVYAGKVGTGFSAESLRTLRQRLEDLERAAPPFVTLPRGAPRKGVHWVEPRLVCEIEFTQWTSDGRLRHPSFEGLRDDKDARQVRRETRRAMTAVPAAHRGTRAPEAARRGRAVLTPGKRGARSGDTVAGVRLTNPDRILYPEIGLTKVALARYYEAIADWILPHVVGRPLALVRCPEGRAHTCFFQKHASPGMPEAIHRRMIPGKTGPEEILYIEDLPGLVALVQMGVLEIHVWGSRVADIEHPDRIVFDFDPDPTASAEQMVDGAQMVRDLLAQLDLVSFVKTTGGKGLHVVVPIEPKHSWSEVKAFAQAISQAIVRAHPRRYTATLSKAARKHKVFIDYLRNGRGATAIATYSTRAREGAPVAAAIAWPELGASLRPDRFHVADLPGRLHGLGSDPWRGFDRLRQTLPSLDRLGARPRSRAKR